MLLTQAPLVPFNLAQFIPWHLLSPDNLGTFCCSLMDPWRKVVDKAAVGEKDDSPVLEEIAPAAQLLPFQSNSPTHPVPTSTPLKNRYSHPIPSFCYVVEKKRRHILPICHFLCFFFISINLNNSMHFRQSSNNKYLYLLLFQSHCR